MQGMITWWFARNSLNHPQISTSSPRVDQTMLWVHQVLRGDTDLEMLHYGAWGRGAHETLRSSGGIGLT